MNETWKWVSGYEGLYQISNTGKLKSFWHDRENGKIVSVKNSKEWYLTICLVDKNHKRSTKRIHQMVAEAFIGKIPSGHHVHHKDGNKQNNCVDNLEIVHPTKHRLITIEQYPEIVKAMNNYNKFIRPEPIRQYTLDGHYIAEYANSSIAEVMTGVCQRNILQVANHTPYGKHGYTRSQAGGYKWVFRKDDDS